MKITVHARGIQIRNIDFVGGTNFIFVRYSVTNSGPTSNCLFRLQGNFRPVFCTEVVLAQEDQPLLSSRGRPHFERRKFQERTKIWSWVATGPETMTDCAGDGQWQILFCSLHGFFITNMGHVIHRWLHTALQLIGQHAFQGGSEGI